MSQARKGTATLFRADRRFVLSGYQPTLIVDVALDLLEEASVPTPPMTFTSFLCISSESRLLKSNEYNVFSGFVPHISHLNIRSLKIYFLLALYHSFLLSVKTIPIPDKGAGFAYKGTNILDETARRWAALQAIPSMLTAEANLALTSEVVLPSIQLVLEALLRLFSFQKSHNILTLALWQRLSNELVERFTECKKSAIKISHTARGELSGVYSIYLSQDASYHLINKPRSSVPLLLLTHYSSLFHLEEILALLLYSHFIGEIPGKNIYASLLSLEPGSIQHTIDIYNLDLNFFLTPFFTKLYLFISLLYHFLSTIRGSSTTAGVIQTFSQQACISSDFIEELKLTFLFYSYSVFSFLWSRHLILKSILQICGLKSLIGMILMELSTSSAFLKSSEFISELLVFLTSNVPPAKPPIPVGKIFFADLMKVYGYSFRGLIRIYKYLIDLES